MTDLQEYQDARGFAEIAGEIASDLGPIARGIERAKTLWIGLVPQTDQKNRGTDHSSSDTRAYEIGFG